MPLKKYDRNLFTKVEYFCNSKKPLPLSFIINRSLYKSNNVKWITLSCLDSLMRIVLLRVFTAGNSIPNSPLDVSVVCGAIILSAKRELFFSNNKSQTLSLSHRPTSEFFTANQSKTNTAFRRPLLDIQQTAFF